MLSDAAHASSTVTYTLSWEEFLELSQSSLPKAGIWSFAAALSIATAIGIFGGVLTYAVDPGSKAIASIFCVLSLLLFAASFWDLIVRTKKRKARALKKLRFRYELYFADEQKFAFDHEKWALGTTTKKHETLWASLMSTVETQNTIALSTTIGSTLVPKRVLDRQALDSLRRITYGENEESWHFHVSLLEYVLTEAESRWRRRPFLMVTTHTVGLSFFLMIAYGLYDKTGPEVSWGWLVALLVLILTVGMQFFYPFVNYQTSDSLRHAWEAKFSDRGVWIRIPDGDSFSTWINFAKTQETRRSFLLYLNLTTYNIYPKSCLSVEQQSTLRELLRSKLTSK